jgi:hypothetical protein
MYKVVALILGFMVVTGGTSFAQDEPAEVPLNFAVGIPDANLPTIDGNDADWAWVDKSFEITIDDMNALTGGADDADDLFVDLLMGWNQSQNRVYAMVHVHDDELIVDVNPSCTWKDDTVEMHFDPDNGGGGTHTAGGVDLQPAWQICLSFSEQFSRVQMYSGGLSAFDGADAFDFWWTHSGDFIEIAQINDDQEYYYEFSGTLFDPLAIGSGPDGSTPWILAPEQIIGWSISVDDADPGTNVNGEDGSVNNNYWQAMYSVSEMFMNQGGIADVYLTPVEVGATAVEANSWGQLKKLVNEDL